MVSTDAPTFDLSFVNLKCGDPELLETIIPMPSSGEYQGRNQELQIGSYCSVEGWDSQSLTGDFTIGVWIFPTLKKTENQPVLSDRDVDGNGFEIGLTKNGKPYFMLGKIRVVSKVALPIYRWYHLTVRLRNNSLELRAKSHFRDLSCFDDKTFCLQKVEAIPSSNNLFFAINKISNDHFNGKISDPCIFDVWLDDKECSLLENDISGEKIMKSAKFAWDFGRDISTQTVKDMTGKGNHGMLSQLPVRSVTGPHWFGNSDNPLDNLRSYAAIHFHEDSLSNAEWSPDLSMKIPKQWKSGVYAAKLVVDNQVDYLPFAVLPSKGTSSADVAYLLPTFTYLAYANEMQEGKGQNSLYDRYLDGAGVPFTSLLQPLLNIRPQKGLLLNKDGQAFSRNLNADLSMLHWLTEMNIKFDVLSDHDLHREGEELLSQYKVVATGSHPEYASSRMLDGIEGFLKSGGNLMYLGGNGFYWVTDLSGDEKTIEVRRPNGTRPWTSEPGEGRHQFSGEIGGLWRGRGRPPQKLTGVGFTAQGWTEDDRCGPAQPYIQSNARDDDRVADLYRDIHKDELIGDFESLGLGRGAAGDEVDRVDPKLGTPHQAIILGSAIGFSTEYHQAIEEICQINRDCLKQDDANIRADLVWFDTLFGGAVFSAGSINWISCLTYNNCQNTVSTLTYNALTRMLKDNK